MSPRLDRDQRVIKSLRWLHKLACLHGIFSCQSFTTFLHRRVCFKKQMASVLHCSAGSGDILFFFFFNLFILLLAALGLCCCTGFSLHLVVKGGSCCSLTASHCGAFYCCKAQALGARELQELPSWALECRFSSCDTGRLIALQHVGCSWIREAPSGDILKTILEEFSSINLVLERPVVPWM